MHVNFFYTCVYVAFVCAVIAATQRLNTHISRASHVFNHTIWYAAWALRLCVKFPSFFYPLFIFFCMLGLMCCCLFPSFTFNPPAEAKHFWDEKQRQWKKENMQCIIKQGRRHEVLCKVCRNMELNLFKSLFLSSTINVLECILAKVQNHTVSTAVIATQCIWKMSTGQIIPIHPFSTI